MKYLIAGHIPGIELELSFATDGSRAWHHNFNFPSWGIDLDAYDLISPYLGYAVAARAFYDLPLNKKRSLGLKMGIGLGYIDKPFDKDENFHNSIIGSTFNAALALSLHGNISLSQKWVLKPGIGIHHFSNGAFRMPNAGINMAMLDLRISYHPSGTKLPERNELPFKAKPAKWYIGASYGLKQIYPINGSFYNVVHLFGIYQKRITNKTSFGGELGLNYNASLEDRINELNTVPGVSSDNYRAYLAGIFQLHFDPIGIRFEAGTYLFPKFTLDGMIFFRYQILYNLNRFQFFAGLKSHFATADNCEVGIAYQLK